MIKIMIDPGHGGSDFGSIGPNGAKEKDIVLNIALALGKELRRAGIEVDYTRTSDVRIVENLKNDLVARAEKANLVNANIYLALHCNSLGAQSEGVETYCLALGGQGEKLAQALQSQMVEDLGLKDRGVKTANYAVLRVTNMLAILIELGFISNPKEEKLLQDPEFQYKAAKSIAKGLYNRLGIKVTEIEDQKPEISISTDGVQILGKATATLEQAVLWAKANHAPQKFIDLAKDYWLLGEIMGINPVVAYAQFAHETDFLYRTGKFHDGVNAQWFNPCGLRTAEGERDYEGAEYVRFANWVEGITAHLDHLALYAGAEGYPKAQTLDPRPFKILHGTAKTVEQLGGLWSSSPLYGELVIKKMRQIEHMGDIQRKENGKYPEELKIEAREAWEWVTRSGISEGRNPKQTMTQEEVWMMMHQMWKQLKNQ